jgi:hypothetical protein
LCAVMIIVAFTKRREKKKDETEEKPAETPQKPQEISGAFDKSQFNKRK